jgi:hypothetical protein
MDTKGSIHDLEQPLLSCEEDNFRGYDRFRDKSKYKRT